MNFPDYSTLLVWGHLFTNKNIDNNNITISIVNNNELQTLTMGKDENFTNPPDSDDSFFLKKEYRPSTLMNYPLRVNFKGTKTEDNFYFLATEKEVVILLEKPTSSKIIPTSYISSKNIINLEFLFSKVESMGHKSKCLKFMRLFDKRIKNLSLISSCDGNILFANMDLISKVPVHVLGDGFNKFLYIILSMLANPYSIILIDEIETSFHYSFYPKLLEVIKNLVVETNCQVFVTTQNYDCLSAAVELIGNSETEKNLFRLIKLDLVNGTIIPKIFADDPFIYPVNKSWEIR
jgi:AAA15 family ATPase/GTPase